MVQICAMVLVAAVIECAAQSSTVADDEDVQLFTTSAYPDPDGRYWRMPVHGWIFEREKGSWWRSALQKGVLDMLELKEADSRSKILERRLEMFLVDNERGKTLTVRICGVPWTIGPSGPDGHFVGEARLPGQILGPDSPSLPRFETVVLAAVNNRRFRGRIQLAAAQGLSVISDIDDTIKVSHVLDKGELLANTFLREFQPVPGMAAVYRRWADQGAVFHYVSASPWQLYPELERFIDQAGFPAGEILLRHLRIKDTSFFAFMRSSRKYKSRSIEALMRRYPQRRFILVGDSGENDPAVYAAAARSHPFNVAKIYIRLVSPEAAHRRLVADCFKGLPRERWDLFGSGKQLGNSP